MACAVDEGKARNEDNSLGIAYASYITGAACTEYSLSQLLLFGCATRNLGNVDYVNDATYA